RAIAKRSDQIGKDLNTALSATGIKETDLETKLGSLAAQEQQEVAQAVQLNPPGPLQVEHDDLIEVLKLRASGLSRMATASRRQESQCEWRRERQPDHRVDRSCVPGRGVGLG